MRDQGLGHGCLWCNGTRSLPGFVSVHPGLRAHLHSHHNTSVPTCPGSRLEITQTQCFSNKPKLLDQHGAGSAPWPDCRPCFLPHTLGRGHLACSSPGCHLFTRSPPLVLGLILEVPSCGVPSCRLSILETEMAFLHMEFSENHQLLSLTGGWAWPGGCPCTFGKPCCCEGWGSAPTGAQLSPSCRPLPPGGHPQPGSLTPDHYHCSCFRHSSGPDGVPLHRAHGRRHCGSWCTCSLDHKARMAEPGPVGFQKQGEALTFSAPHPHLSDTHCLQESPRLARVPARSLGATWEGWGSLGHEPPDSAANGWHCRLILTSLLR